MVYFVQLHCCAVRRARVLHISHVSIEWEMFSLKSCGGQQNPVGMAKMWQGMLGVGSYKW